MSESVNGEGGTRRNGFSAVRRGYLRVRDGACLAINISGHQPIEYSARVTPLHKELGHKAHVDEPHLMREATDGAIRGPSMGQLSGQSRGSSIRQSRGNQAQAR